MPTYAYACTACGHRFETQQAFSDAALTECPECSGRLRKLFNTVGIVFKGSGFYRTDSRGTPGGGDKGDKAPDAAAKGDGASKSSESSSAGAGATTGSSSGSSGSASGSGSSGSGSSGSGSSGSGSSGSGSSGSGSSGSGSSGRPAPSAA